MRSKVVISATSRPHICCDCHGPCWCRPKVVTCECGGECADVVVHRDVDIHQPGLEKMAVFSEQLQYGTQ